MLHTAVRQHRISSRTIAWRTALARRLQQGSKLAPEEARRNVLQELKWLEDFSKSTSAAQPAWKQRRFLAKLVARRTRDHEPLAYVLGTQPFGSLMLDVRPPVLIPRPETEEWTVNLADLLKAKLRSQDRPLRLLEVGSGSGCISLLLAATLPKEAIEIKSIDIEPQAQALALQNQAKVAAQLRNKVEFLLADFVDHIGNSEADLLISNPPYIAQAEYEELEPSVREWESATALLGGQDGLDFYRKLALWRPGRALPGSPSVVVEIGADQAEDVKRIFQTAQPGARTEVWKDAQSLDRCVLVYLDEADDPL